MRKLEKYTGNKTYMFPNGKLATVAAVSEQFPAWGQFVHIVETDEGGQVMFAFQNLSAMRSMHNIDPSLSEDGAITALQTALNAPPPANTQPSPEERIADSLEFQSMMMLPDTTLQA